MRGAPAADPPVDIAVRRCRDEVVVLSGSELHPPWGGGERPEGDGEVHQLVWLGALGNDAGVGVGDAAGVKLLLVHAVYDVGLNGLGPGTPLIERADDVDLVILPRLVALIHINDVIRVVYSEDGIARVPVHVVVLAHRHARRHQQVQEQEQDHDGSAAGHSRRSEEARFGVLSTRSTIQPRNRRHPRLRWEQVLVHFRRVRTHFRKTFVHGCMLWKVLQWPRLAPS